MRATQQNIVNGFKTELFKVKVAGTHTVTTSSLCNPVSGVSITIAQSGSTTASVATPTTSPVQEHVELNGKFNCAVDDILTITISSAAAGDQPPSLLKTTINIKQGV